VNDWPTEAAKLRDELGGNPGRLALIVDDDLVLDNAEALARAWRVPKVQVGKTLTAAAEPGSSTEILRRLGLGSVFVDAEILFWRDLRLDPVGLFRQLARTAPRAFLWPGGISSNIASFSRPGRPDHYETRLSDAIVLRALVPRFPDEPPYQMERIP
jgi:hypothetical protein